MLKIMGKKICTIINRKLCLSKLVRYPERKRVKTGFLSAMIFCLISGGIRIYKQVVRTSYIC